MQQPHKPRKRRKWRIADTPVTMPAVSDTLREWAERSDDETAIAIRAQTPTMSDASGVSTSSASSASVLHGGAASGRRSDDARTECTASGKRSGERRADSASGGGKVGEAKRKDLGALKALDVIAFNREAEMAFVALLSRLISDGGGEVLLIDAIRETAWHLDISTETAKRYLLKHTASAAEFVSDGKVVRLRC